MTLTLDICAVLSHGPVSFSSKCVLCACMLLHDDDDDDDDDVVVVVVVFVIITSCTALNVPPCILSLKSFNEII